MFTELYPDPEDQYFARALEAALRRVESLCSCHPIRPEETLRIDGIELHHNPELGRVYCSYRRRLDFFPEHLTRWSFNLVRIVKVDHPGLGIAEGPRTFTGPCRAYVESNVRFEKSTDRATHFQTITVQAATLREANDVYDRIIRGEVPPDER
jgi:hypothetical protein